ncbi:pseudoazurin [Sulfitobacter sp. SK012]|uniref:plastocyanin/azurin family copper-binding protein n=1 Tax=Sulfitobacter sp. SK012 TaxID=1389005 RepID=UPI000E0A1900|nr:plastocyanin/azurin family copper-binding protein [Sulfitobacter sp. SK012]AXI48516.1 pseudoazurin [Sulfitobacter sp. SK012]
MSVDMWKMTPNVTHRPSLRLIVAGAFAPGALPVVSNAQVTHEIKMLNDDPSQEYRYMVFSSKVVVTNSGDTVILRAANRGHITASSWNMLPEGVTEWAVGIDKEVALTLTVPSFYGYTCIPHADLGMAGLIVVRGEGRNNNLERAQSTPQFEDSIVIWQENWKEVAALSLDGRS